MIVGILLCLYVLGLALFLRENGSWTARHGRLDLRAAARDVLEAVVWPLGLLPWRDLCAEWWLRLKTESVPRSWGVGL